MDNTKKLQRWIRCVKEIIAPNEWQKRRLRNNSIEWLADDNHKVRIWFSKYFYIPAKHIGLVYKDGIFQRYLFPGLHKIKSAKETVCLEESSYSRNEITIDVTYRDGSTYRIDESIGYVASRAAIHANISFSRRPIELILDQIYPLVRDKFATIEPKDSHEHINNQIMLAFRDKLAKYGIWLMFLYPKGRRKIKYLKYIDSEDTNQSQNLNSELQQKEKKESTMDTNNFDEQNEYEELNEAELQKYRDRRMLVKLASYAIGGIFCISLISGCFSIIETGERGVVLRFGEYKYTMSEGLNFKAPIIDSVYKLQVRDRSYNSDVEVSSKDMQTIKISSALVYSLDESKVGDIYRRYGNNIETTIIKPTVAEVINSTIAQYPIEEFVNKRDEISQKIMSSLKVRLADIGIDIKSFLITNHDFSDDYNKAIEQKKIAEQAAITAEYNKQKAQLDSEANKYRQEGLSKYVLMEKFLDKWDGHMPKVLTGNDNNMSMILNSSDLGDK